MDITNQIMELFEDLQGYSLDNFYLIPRSVIDKSK